MKRSQTVAAVLVGAAVVGSLTLALPAFAQEQEGQNTSQPQMGMGQMMPRPAVVGTVASVSGTMLTVTARGGEREQASTTTATTFTVDATNATVTKNGATSMLSAIAVGDLVMVRGTISGTQVVATSVSDGRQLGRPDFAGKNGKSKGHGDKNGRMMNIASGTPKMMSVPSGTGEPIVGGSVASISGTALTLTTSGGTSYSVNAASTTVMKAGATATLSAISVGDTVIVQGTVNGTSISASSIIDQGAAPTSQNENGSQSEGSGSKHGFFGSVGGFFSHFFGFF